MSALSAPFEPRISIALIVAIDGAAAVRDLAERTRARPQGHDGGVDVGGIADRGIGQHAGGGEDLDRLLSEQPARHVEIVDHHVAEQAARDSHIGDRRRARVAAGDAEQLDPADPTVPQLALQPGEVRIEPAIEPDHQRHTALGDDRKTCLGAPPVEVERLLAENGLAGTRRRFDQIGVGIRRASDDDGVDRRIGKGRGLRTHYRGVTARQAFRGGAIDIGDRGKARSWMARDILRVDAADTASAELAEADHGRSFDERFKTTI